MNAEVDYTIYWGLRALPFNNVPDPRFYVPSSQHDAANRWLSYGIQTRKCLLLLTGEIGCGKTLLSRRLIVGLSPAQYDVALICQPEDRGPCASRPFTAEETTSYITARMGAATIEQTCLPTTPSRSSMD